MSSGPAEESQRHNNNGRDDENNKVDRGSLQLSSLTSEVRGFLCIIWDTRWMPQCCPLLRWPESLNDPSQVARRKKSGRARTLGQDSRTPKSSPICALTVSKEFDPLFSWKTQPLEPLAGMTGVGAVPGPQPRVPPQQASCSRSWVGHLSRYQKTAGAAQACPACDTHFADPRSPGPSWGWVGGAPRAIWDF